MSKRLPSPRLAKIHRNYTTEEIAKLLDVHKNTVGNWIKQGLPICGKKRPFLVTGRDLRAFLERKRVKNKRTCSADEIYCMRCRAPKKPAADLIEYKAVTDTLGNLVALCPDCASIMNRRISLTKLKQIQAYQHITQPLAETHITLMAFTAIHITTIRSIILMVHTGIVTVTVLSTIHMQPTHQQSSHQDKQQFR